MDKRNFADRAGQAIRHQVQAVARRAGYRFIPARDHLIHLDYPVSTVPRYGHGRPSHRGIAAVLDQRRDVYGAILSAIELRGDLLSSIPEEASGDGPYWNNTWFGPLDASVLMHFLLERKPANYLEIGSGNSTLYARHAIRHGGLTTRITSIDPQPRREIDKLCDRVVRQSLETVDLSAFDELADGDILFFDGSHRIFNDSDVTVFFLDVLPRVKPGVLIHIHDIFWPDDYPREWEDRYYSEQYMLGVKILDGTIDTLFPSYFVSTDPKLGRQASGFLRGKRHLGESWGTSYWFTRL